jgi:hypothetical protein
MLFEYKKKKGLQTFLTSKKLICMVQEIRPCNQEQCLTFVIPVTQEADIRRILV